MNCGNVVRFSRFNQNGIRCLLLLVLVVRSNLAVARVETDGSVDVTLVGSAAEDTVLRRLLNEWNSALAIRQSNYLNADEVLKRTGSQGHLRIWVVLASPRVAKLYFADPSGERFLIREVPLATGLDESGRETLAQVIATSATAFVDKRVNSTPSEIAASFRVQANSAEPQTAAGSGPSHDSPPVSPPSAGQVRIGGSVVPTEIPKTDAQPGAWQPRLGAAYSATLVNAENVSHGPGAFVALARSFKAWRWLAAVQGQYRLPLHIQDTAGVLSLRTWSLSGTSALEWSLTNDWAAGFDLGLGVQRITFSLKSAPGSSVTPHSGSSFRPSLPVSVRSAHRLGQVRATTLLGMDIGLVRTHYDVGTRLAFVPWIVEPRCAVELSW